MASIALMLSGLKKEASKASKGFVETNPLSVIYNKRRREEAVKLAEILSKHPNPVVRGLARPSGDIIKIATDSTDRITSGVKDVSDIVKDKSLSTQQKIYKGGRGVLNVARGVLTAPTATTQPALSAITGFLPDEGLSGKAKRVLTGVQRGITLNEDIGKEVQEKPVKVLGADIDPLITAGSLAGFTKNPMWKRILPKTSSIASVFDPISTKGKVANFVFSRLSKGGIEGLVQGWTDIPDNTPQEEAVKQLLINVGFGAVAELGADSVLKSLGLANNKTTKKQLEKMGKYFTEVKRKALVPVKNFVNPVTQQREDVPMWKYIAYQLIDKTKDRLKLENRPGFLDIESVGKDTNTTQPKGVGGEVEFTPKELPQTDKTTLDISTPLSPQKSFEIPPQTETPPTRDTVRLQVEKTPEISDQSLNSIISDFKPNTPKTKVNILDYWRTPINVLKKIGLGKEGALLKDKYRDYTLDLPKQIDKVTSWYEQVKNVPDSSNRLFKYLDGQDIDLSDKETVIAKQIKEYLSEWADKLKIPKEKRIQNYITHLFDDELISKEFSPELAKLIDNKPAGSVYDPFLQKRYGVTGFKEDVWEALDAYTKRATRKFHMDQALGPLAKASEKLDKESVNYVTKLTSGVNMRPTELESLTDNLMKSVWGYKLGVRPVATLTRKIRQAFYRGMLGGNVGSAVKNLTQVANTYSQLGEKYTIKGYLDFFRSLSSNTTELEKTGVLSQDIIQDRTINATKKFWEKADKGIFSLFELAEKINRGSAYFGAKAKFLDKGLGEEQAIKKAVEMVEKTQFSFGSVDTPVAMQGSIPKLLTQFMSYNIKQTELLSGMVKDKEFMGLARYVGAHLLMMKAMGELYDTSWKDMVPFLSNLSSGRFASPTVNLLTGTGKAIFGEGRGKEEGVNTLKSTGLGLIPVGVQGKKTVEGISTFIKGRDTTPSGRTRYEVDKTPSNLLRMSVFGKRSIPEAREYYDNLGESKSSIFLKDLEGLSKEKTADKLSELEKSNPSLFKEVVEEKRLRSLNITKEERRIKNLPLEDRAREVKEIMGSIKSNEEKKRVLLDYVQKKIITESLLEKMSQLE